MRMIDRRARSFTVVLEDQNVSEALVILQVQHAIPVPPEYVFHGTLRQSSQRRRMVWRFHDHFMSADSVHLVEEAFSFAVQPAFDAQCRKFIGHHTNTPTRCVGPPAVSAINQNLGRRLVFVAPAKGAILAVFGATTHAEQTFPPL